MRQVTKEFEKSPEKRHCKKCQGEHGIGYVTYLNNTTHILMWCDSKKETAGAPFETGLDIPSTLSVPARKHNKKIDDIKQSDIYKYLVGRRKRSSDSLPEKIKPY